MARSRGRFPPGPSIRLPFGKQRLLGDFDELERQGFLREHALARQDRQTAKPVCDAMREQLAREDALGDKADKVALQAATLVQNMKAAGMGPNEIAAQLQHQFGTPVSPADVASGEGWWIVGQRPQPIAPAPLPPTMPRVSFAELWPREDEPGACAGPRTRRLGRRNPPWERAHCDHITSIIVVIRVEPDYMFRDGHRYCRASSR
jgi:hypothetical protein